MFCSKCGRIIEENIKFCGGCGTPVPTQNNVQSQGNVIQNKAEQNMQQNYNSYFDNRQVQEKYNQSYQNYDSVINPSMKKFAILSIVIPAISIFIYIFVGLTVYIAILLSMLGFEFAKKGALYSKKLSKIGYVLNTILGTMAVLVWIVVLIATLV